jgi:acetyltransferase-like isoleucine patch superfamily enzyme
MTAIKRFIQYAIYRMHSFISHKSRIGHYNLMKAKGILTTGRHTYGLPRIDVYKGSECKIIIGNFCSISRDVVMVAGGIHPMDWVSTYPFRAQWGLNGAYEDGMPLTKGDIVIGSDVWIGTEVMIFSGVTIGHGSVIASRAVVTRDVPPYAIVAGAPAKVLKYRFEPQIVEQLLQIRWWEWSDDGIRRALPILSSANIEGFVSTYSQRGAQ